MNMQLSDAAQAEVDAKRPKSARSLEEGGMDVQTISCPTCCKAICQIWVTNTKSPRRTNVRAHCPYCPDKGLSDSIEICGEFQPGGISRPRADDREDAVFVTVLGDIEYVDDNDNNIILHLHKRD